MFKINKLRLEILSNKSKTIEDLYGFDLSFSDGLNIIAGPNSRGKTTINTCIFYALGMEQLLGANNEKALDKALKEEFSINIEENDEERIEHKVLVSKIILEIENDIGIIVCLERHIKSNVTDVKTTLISAHYIELDRIYADNIEYKYEKLYVNSRGDNDNPNGFYQWLSNFIGIELPQVSNSALSSNYSPLYLQTIFSSLFIEQTKGWSDFLATMPFYGITKAKEKVVEFLLNLNEIKLSTEKDILYKERNIILEEWRKRIKGFSFLERQSNSMIVNVPEELTTEASEIDGISVYFSIGLEEKISLKNFYGEKKELWKEIENKPISTIQENREETLIEFDKQKKEYSDLKKYIENFERKFLIEKNQLVNLHNQLRDVEREIKDHLNLIKVFNENIINSKNTNNCPTCSQEVTIELISDKNIKIPQLSLEENTNFLRSQKKIIETSIVSLENTIGEKEVLLTYFNNNLREKEILIKSISKDLISDDRAFSSKDVVRRIQLEREIETLKQLHKTILEIKSELKDLANKYYNNAILIEGLGKSEKEDEEKVNDFEITYKDLLFDFGYDSNLKYQISINRKEPFKYFPIYKNNKGDSIPQSIRINSSASDFVRNIWAYTLSLAIGENHPGVIIMDEPGQHRTNMDSLKKLFSICSQVSGRQIIIFTSIDKELNNKEKIDLNILIEDLNEDDYNLIRLDNNQKIIQKI